MYTSTSGERNVAASGPHFSAGSRRPVGNTIFMRWERDPILCGPDTPVRHKSLSVGVSFKSIGGIPVVGADQGREADVLRNLVLAGRLTEGQVRDNLIALKTVEQLIGKRLPEDVGSKGTAHVNTLRSGRKVQHRIEVLRVDAEVVFQETARAVVGKAERRRSSVVPLRLGVVLKPPVLPLAQVVLGGQAFNDLFEVTREQLGGSLRARDRGVIRRERLRV